MTDSIETGEGEARELSPAEVSALAPTLRPCRSPYCECDEGGCTHPGCYDARGGQLRWPDGWRVQRNPDGSVGIFGPPPRDGESPRTSDVIYPRQRRDLDELMFRFFSHALAQAVPRQAAPTDEQVAEAIEREFSDTGEWPEGDPGIVRAYLKHTVHGPTSRESLRLTYLDWRNNFLTVAKFAEHCGLSEEHGRRLVELARDVFNSNHPEV